MKNLSNIKLHSLQGLAEGIKVDQDIKDTPRKVTHYHFCRSNPKVRNQPQLFGLSRSALNLIGLTYDDVKNDPNTPLFLSGSKLIQGSQPTAHNYCGYQFGSWAGQLGDGRAHNLGTIVHQNKRYELQLKGSGLTPFSRHADGNSVVSSAVRQFLASELMVGLGIPTTRAVSLVLASQPVKRDPLYNGVIKVQKAAIVLRMCETLFRFGSLEVCLPRGNMRRQNLLENRSTLQPICDYVIKQHFPEISWEDQDPYEELYKAIVRKSAQLVAYWQSIGFCHGVLNTDNMSLGGVTIDYGPYAFIDYFSKDFVSNASDDHERYSYRQQPSIIRWNLQKLAEAMDCLIPHSITTKYLRENFEDFYNAKYYRLMSEKLGISDGEESRSLINALIDTMHYCGTHFTNFFRVLEEYPTPHSNLEQFIAKIVECSEPTQFYLKTLRAFPQLIGANYQDMLAYDSGFNKQFINQQRVRVETAERLRREGCKERNSKEVERWRQWAGKYCDLRKNNASQSIKNPKYVLLNFIAKQITQELAQLSGEESVKLLDRILQVLLNPWEKDEWFEEKYWRKPPVPVILTCSS